MSGGKVSSPQFKAWYENGLYDANWYRGTAVGSGGGTARLWWDDSLSGMYVNNTFTFGGSAPVMSIRMSVRDVMGIDFRTLVGNDGGGQEREVVWFEDEGFADGLARLAEAFRE